jgi:hypothetical protein
MQRVQAPVQRVQAPVRRVSVWPIKAESSPIRFTCAAEGVLMQCQLRLGQLRLGHLRLGHLQQFQLESGKPSDSGLRALWGLVLGDAAILPPKVISAYRRGSVYRMATSLW